MQSAQNNDVVEIDNSTFALLERYQQLQLERKVLDESIDATRARIEEVIGENQAATFNGELVLKWAYSTRTSFDIKKAKELLSEDQIQSCSRVDQVRSFRPVAGSSL